MKENTKKQNINHIDYKNIELIKKFINPHGQIMGRNKTGLSAINQRELAQAVKRARFMALLPYISN
ncbi:MAG: 30S ribosomal protein S18 [Candidatus Pacebacteria bacterium]|nr:30S ribosomal protein S18 [Candidatus Paceibacterota bacterium]